MVKQRVAVLFGGRSGEHEVSVVSASGVMKALDRSRWDVVPVAIGKNGGWLTEAETRWGLGQGWRSFETEGRSPLQTPEALAMLATCDVVFPLVHGTYGEDGTLQGFLEIAGLPYAGAGVAASALGMDKALMKALFHEAGIPVAPYTVIREWDLRDGDQDATTLIEHRTGYPCFVKPANGGSSVGVSRALSREDLGAAFAFALKYDDKIVVEKAITGREVECSVLGNEAPEASVVGEIVPDRAFYDYDSKYSPESVTKLHIPAPIAPSEAEEVRQLAVRMFQVMGCEGYARVDFFLQPDGRVIANEVNTIPGFTSISMYPKLWEASGLAYSALLDRVLELAFERHERRSRR